MSEADVAALIAAQMAQSSADGGYGGGILGVLTLLLVTYIVNEIKRWRDAKKNGYAKEEHIKDLGKKIEEFRKESLERANQNRADSEARDAEIHRRVDTVEAEQKHVRETLGYLKGRQDQ